MSITTSGSARSAAGAASQGVDLAARRSAAARKAAVSRKRGAAARARMLADMAPGSPFVGSQPIDGDIGRTLARIRAHLESGQ